MKCNDFEAIVLDLLNGILEEPEQGEALEHAYSCKKCEAILFEQQRLNLELQTLAVGEWSGQAPPELEQRLVSAFKEHFNELKASSLPASSSFHSLWKMLAGEKKWKHATIAVSLAFCIFLFWSVLDRSPVNPDKTAATIYTKYEKAAPLPDMHRTIMSPTDSEAVPDVRSFRRTSRGKPSPKIEWITAEAATDFYAIPYVVPFGPHDRVRIIRIQAPYSLVAHYGIPVYGDQAFRSVQADIMVGDDNVARAIRFIEQWKLQQTQSRGSFLETNY
jgi:hypothetical protein